MSFTNYNDLYRALTAYSIGSTGPEGIAGPRGPRGTGGDIGQQGATGSDGSTGSTGSIGPIGYTGPSGKGFVVFAHLDSTAQFITMSPPPTSDNIGEFVIIKVGDLYVYVGPNNGDSGPNLAYQYVGDITDEAFLM